jgi:hypothetical protein
MFRHKQAFCQGRASHGPREKLRVTAPGVSMGPTSGPYPLSFSPGSSWASAQQSTANPKLTPSKPQYLGWTRGAFFPLFYVRTGPS